MRKTISKRRWKARMMQGLWVPRIVIEGYGLTAPEHFDLVWHPTEDFLRITMAADLLQLDKYEPQKRAWE